MKYFTDPIKEPSGTILPTFQTKPVFGVPTQVLPLTIHDYSYQFTPFETFFPNTLLLQDKYKSNFLKACAENSKMHDGERGVILYHPTQGIYWANMQYSTYWIAQNNPNGKFPDGPFVPCGGAGVVRTSDDKIIVGGRTATMNPKDPTQYQVQFPCGFHDIDPNNQSRSLDLETFLNQEAIRETREELLEKFFIRHCELLGCVALLFPKQIPIIQTFFTWIEINLTFDQLLKKRKKNRPSDAYELEPLGFFTFNDVVSMLNRNVTLFLDGRDRSFAGSLGVGVFLLYHAMMQGAMERSLKYMRFLSMPNTFLKKLQKKKSLPNIKFFKPKTLALPQSSEKNVSIQCVHTV